MRNAHPIENELDERSGSDDFQVTTRQRNRTTQQLVVREAKRTVTSSRIVADHFGKEHKSVLRAIANLRDSLGEARFSRLTFAPRDFIERGKTHTEFVMDDTSFAVLAMGFTGAKAACLRQDFVEAFSKATRRIAVLERQQPEWKAARKQVAEAHSAMSMVLTAVRERAGKATVARHYANEAWLLTFALTGKAKPAIDRQSLHADELAVLTEAERLNTRMLVLDASRDERKAACRALVLSRQSAQLQLARGAA